MDQVEFKKYLDDVVKQAFDFGVEYSIIMQGNVIANTFPKDYNKAVQYAKDYILEKKRDSECLECGRYVKGSCKGVIPRQRKEITEGNRCGGYYNIQ